MGNKKNYVDGVDVSECEHYRAEIETKMPYGEYEIQKDKCHYSGIEIIQNCKGNKGCLYKQLQRAKAENEKLKFELKSEQKDNKYIKNCCIRAGKELEKYSFKWDGKEKNLVVQALELNEQYEKLQAENKRLKEESENYAIQLGVLAQALEDIRDIADRTDGNHPASVINMVSVIRHTINSVIGAE